MVRLVVDDDDILERQQLAAGSLEHGAFGFRRLDRGVTPLQEGAPDLRQLHHLTAFEGVVIGQDDLGLGDIEQHVGRHQLAFGVVVVRV